MKSTIAFCSPLLATLALAPRAHATDYYFGPSGSASAACTEAAPCALNYNMSGKVPKAGDTVYLLGGTYNNQYIRPSSSGTASAWITYKAVDGQLPILKGTGASGCGVEPSAAVQYVRFEGIASVNWGSSGFSNGWNTPSGKIEFVNCIADGNGINGITFYKTTGVLIKQSIVAHNGNKDPSWSSGVNLFTAGGTFSDNIVSETVSFENIDISSHRTDGSGFILDENSQGATFINNIGFRNGGSCIRLTNSPNSHIINNTCVGDGIDANVQYHQEIFYSQTVCQTGAVLRNNVLVASAGNKALQGTPATSGNNVLVDGGGAADFFASSSGELDFHLVSGATSLIDKGATAEAPTTDIGFDAKCIKKGSPGGASWWSYVIDYDYIVSVGGVKGCFKPTTRTSAPDIGAYEFNGTVPSTGGATGTGGAPTTTGGTTSTGGAPTTTGGTIGSGGTTPIGAGGASTSLGNGGTSAKGGNASNGGTTTSTPASSAGGATTTVATTNSGGNSSTGLGGATTLGGSTGVGASSSNSAAGGSPSSTGNGGNANNATGGSTATNPAGGSSTTSTATGGIQEVPADVGACSCRLPGDSARSPSWVGLGIFGLLLLRFGRRREVRR